MESETIHLELKQAIDDLHLSRTKQVENVTNEVIQRYLFDLSKELFIISKLENYYWEFSSFSTYENHYTRRLNDYLKQNDNEQFSETDFINNEIRQLRYIEKTWYLDFFDRETILQIKKSFKKKELFLNDRLDNLETKKIENTDYIELGKLNAKQKMIYLHKLGVIAFLLEQQPFTSSPTSLATLLSSIIEEKVGTIQPILSAIVSKNLTNKNHPQYAESTDKKINLQLINIGFNPKETN